MVSNFSQEEITQEAHRLHGLLQYVSKTKTTKWTFDDCLSAAVYTLAINKIKKEKNAIILAHSYTTPDLVYGVADFKGDSYELALKARESTANIIVFVGVWFMAETAKIINPTKTILIPAGKAGCTLADSITGQDVENIKKLHPNVPVLCYINSSAEVKAHCDCCVTSGNVFDIAQRIEDHKIIFIPDVLMAKNLEVELKRRETPKEIITIGGSCYVHNQFLPKHILQLKDEYKGIKVLAHPECSPEVCKLCDYVGSTKGMASYINQSSDSCFGLLTEFGLVNRMEAEHPNKKFIWTTGCCSYMKMNSLVNTLQALTAPTKEQIVKVDEPIAQLAKKSINKMFELAK